MNCSFFKYKESRWGFFPSFSCDTKPVSEDVSVETPPKMLVDDQIHRLNTELHRIKGVSPTMVMVIFIDDYFVPSCRKSTKLFWDSNYFPHIQISSYSQCGRLILE